MSAQPPVLLLKTKSLPNDGYHEFFTSHNYNPSFIPVLEHRFHRENLARVRGIFGSGAFDTAKAGHKGKEASKKYGGLIFTSQRAVEAFATLIEEDGLPEEFQSDSPLILYTVGPATARSLRNLRDRHLPAASIHGEDAGNGENLAHLMLEHFNSIYEPSSYKDNAGDKPGLLFLVGEQRRDIIPKTLMATTMPREEQIQVDEMVVYETGEMESFEGDFATSISASADADTVWVVVFSPSGCEAMLRVLKLGPFAEEAAKTGKGRRVFVATIGPTTRDHLVNKFGFQPDVCAEKPSPEGVGDGIQKFMESLGDK